MVINMTSEEKKRRKRKNLLIALGVILAIVIIIAASIAWMWPKSKDISESTVFQAQEVEQIAMINSEIGRDWQTKGYDITEVRDEQIAVMNNLYPYEIVYMKFGKYIDLTNGEQTEQQLRMVFR